MGEKAHSAVNSRICVEFRILRAGRNVLSALPSGRSQPICIGSVRARSVHGRASLSLSGTDVRALRCVRGHADGSWRDLVGQQERVWIDLGFGTVDRTRDWVALQARASSANASESGAVPSDAGRSHPLSWETERAGGMVRSAGGISAGVQRAEAARGFADAATGGALSGERARLSGPAAREGVSDGKHGATSG